MSRLSIEDAVRWTGQFARREWHLLVPVALAFIALPQIALQLLAPLPAGQPDLTAGEQAMMRPGFWLIIPVILVNLYGQIALSALALFPGTSVGEALRTAAARIGTVLLTGMLIGLGMLFCGVILTVVIQLALPLVGSRAALMQVLTAVVAMLLFAVLVRFALLTPLVVARAPGPLAAVRGALALSRGRFWRLAGALLSALLATFLVSAAVQFTLGTLVLLVGQLTGTMEVARAIVILVSGSLAALITGLLAIFLAALYRQADSSGT